MYGGGGMMGAAAPPAQPQQQQQGTGQQKHDIFVGNLAFNTTEEQLHQAFSEIGRVINVRLVSDVETGKPRGFAFVEFQDPQAALSAIRNMNDYELNGRRLRVNFSNSSHLEVLANKLGMDLSQQTQRPGGGGGAAAAASTSTAAGGGGTTPHTPAGTGTNAVADALKNMSKAEMYDVVAKLKEISDRDPDEARRLLSGHPQLPEALLFLMSKLDMVRTPVVSEAPAILPMAPAVPAVPVRVDPRAAMRQDPRQKLAAAAAATAAAASVPTPVAAVTPAVLPTPAVVVAPAAAAAHRIDPRQRADPRARGGAPPPPPTAAAVPMPSMVVPHLPPMPSSMSLPMPPPPAVQPQQPPPYAPTSLPHPPVGGVPTGLDPALVQQVMSLSNHQIQQLPPDKQRSILQLRQQIQGGTGL